MLQVRSKIEPIIFQDRKLLVLDQRLLPYEKKYLELTSYKEVIDAIKNMVVRGAPLIGITAAYGMVLAANELTNVEMLHITSLQKKLIEIGEEIKQSRPTAINLQWAVDLILKDISNLEQGDQILNTIKKRAIWIHEDDRDRCQNIGEYGSKIIEQFISTNILTICNTGALATGGIGTAFGVILTAHQKKIPVKVFASETRPRQQGARLTTFECIENGIDCTLISDTACGYLMKKGEIDLVITGADRITANGDTANKIGTYQLAVLAHEHKLPFYIAAPLSTFDLKINRGEDIPIEERKENEVKEINGKLICSSKVKVRNPAFDVTPSKYITGIITEKGILKGDYKSKIKEIFNSVVVA